MHPTNPSAKKVILFNDTFTEFNHPEIGIAAVTVLEKFGYQVIVPEWTCCGRPAISKGLLEQAKQYSEKILAQLYPHALDGLPIIGLEPSCILTIKDDLLSLIGHHNGLATQQAETIVKQCVSFDEFISRLCDDDRSLFSSLIKTKKRTVRVHGHCHQKSLVGMQPTLNILNTLPGLNVSEISSGCCGLAGSFGYEAEHYEFSMKIGELRLFPAIRQSDPDDIIIANGMSCRSQIAHGTKKKAYHLAEFLAHYLNSSELSK